MICLSQLQPLSYFSIVVIVDEENKTETVNILHCINPQVEDTLLLN